MGKLFDIILDSPTGELEENTVSVLAEGNIEGFGSWTLDKDGLLVIEGMGFMPCWDAWIQRYAPWYEYRAQIRKVSLAEGITGIGNEALDQCMHLTQVYLPAGITSIGKHAFRGCHSLTKIYIPSSVALIREGAFWGCINLTQIDLPDRVKIGKEAFRECRNLTQIHIPSGVADIESQAFRDCNNLRIVTMPARFNVSFFKFCFGISKNIVTFY